MKTCDKCNEGYITCTDKDGLKYYKVCDCLKKSLEEKQLEAQYKHNGFDMRNYKYSPRSYVGTKSSKVKDRLLNYVKKFKENKDVRRLLLYMYGPNGTQKTTLASWVGKTLLTKGFSVRYILMNNLVALLQDCSNFNEEKAQKAQFMIDKFNDTDLLIIDESFDKDKLWISRSGYQLGIIDSFIRERVQRFNKGIIFISNKKPEEIKSQGYSVSIEDFIMRETTLNNTLLTFEDNYLSCSKKEFDVNEGLF